MKKTKQPNTPSAANLNLHVPNLVTVGELHLYMTYNAEAKFRYLGRNGIMIGNTGGGFPPINAQGQRICRQCGLPGRYKDGKCVEKWGPGPEGPGTVCDRYVPSPTHRLLTVLTALARSDAARR